MIVADANLITAYCVNTSATGLAKAVFAKDRIWISPKLWQAEFVSALLKHRRRREFDDEALATSINLARSLMRDFDFDSDIRTTVEIAERTQCSPYDSCYIALAELKRVKLVTIDGGILENAKHVAVSPEQFLAA